MKALKLGVFTLAIGFFTASCGDNTNQDETIHETEIIDDSFSEPTIETINPADTELMHVDTVITE